MSQISIKLNSDYKSFKKDESYNLDGDLIIISGINGSGKTQLLDIINGASKQYQEVPIIDVVIQLNEIDINETNIIYKSFKDFIFFNGVDISEDTFIDNVSNLFIETCKRYSKKAIYSKESYDDLLKKNNESLPWNKLNDILSKLGVKYRVADKYDISDYDRVSLSPPISLRYNSETLLVSDLSDGEKVIINLAFAVLLQSLSDNTDQPVKLLLLDGIDAMLNPTLIKILFDVLQEYYINKGMTVILTTHSPATLALAPDNASFYEIFKKEENTYERLIYKPVSNSKHL